MQAAPDSSNPAAARPRFRQDLVAEPIEENNGRFIDVMDPDTGAVFRFYEVEYSLACAMDGERDVEGIVQWAREELGLQPSVQEVRSVIATLGSLGFIRDGAVRDAEEAAPISAEPSVRAPEPPSFTPVEPPPPQDETSFEGLVPGVVVGAPPPREEPLEVELGTAGTAKAADKYEPLPAPDVALGASGKTAEPLPPAPVEDIALGAPGKTAEPAKAPAAAQLSDVSIDLSQHVDVGAADVKEAVRQSKVMTAVDVPKDLLDALEGAEEPPAPVAAKPAPVAVAPKPEPVVPAPVAAKPEPVAPAPVAAKPEPVAPAPVAAKPEPVVPAPVAAKPEPVAAASSAAASSAAVSSAAASSATASSAAASTAAAKPAVALPKQPAAVTATKTPALPEAPKQGTSKALVVLLVLVVLGAGAFLVWRYVLNKPADETTTSSAPVTQPTTAAQPTAPPATSPGPSAPHAKLAKGAGAPVEIKAPAAGTVEWIAASETAVKSGDVVVKLAGEKAIEAEITALERDMKRVSGELDLATKAKADAEAANNKAGAAAANDRVVDRQKSFDAKQTTHAVKQAELAKLQLAAPADGKLTAVAKPGQKLAADDVIAKLESAPVLAAQFAVKGAALEAQDAVVLQLDGSERTLACTVAAVTAESVSVACPADDSVADGTSVALKI